MKITGFKKIQKFSSFTEFPSKNRKSSKQLLERKLVIFVSQHLCCGGFSSSAAAFA